MTFRFLPAILAALALPLAACSTATAPARAQAPGGRMPPVEITSPAAPDPVWPFAESDLPLDPGYRFGMLDNGMRYIIRPNATPAAQGMVQLWVDGGSIDEDDDEQGYAHYIEHMAFNGSTNVPEGEMVKLLEREGLAFGADTNASTSFDTTLYKLDLPRNDVELLKTALMLMRETASELTFTPGAVARERGVIQSERRVGDTFALRNTRDNLLFQFPDAKVARRLPIGTAEAIEAANPEKLRALYERLYRPDNAALIVVGDFDPDTVETMIRERFADWQNPANPGPSAYGPIDFERTGATDIYLDPALSERVTVLLHGPWQPEPDNVANRRARVLRQIGYGIVNRRLQRIARLDDPPFRGAGFGTSDIFKAGRTTTLVINAAEGEWQRGLAAAQAEYRRAMEFGFTEAEVAEQVANFRSSLEAAAAGADTRQNREFVNAAISVLRDEQVPTTPQSGLERFNALEPDITPESVLAALKWEVIPLDDPLIRFEGRTAPEGGEAALRAAWDEGMAAPLKANPDIALTPFAYEDFGTPGTVVSDKVEPALGIRQIRFANGVMLNLKRTDLDRDRVLVEVNVDGGQMLDTRENPLATAMTQALPLGGLGAHTLDELQSILAGRQVSYNVSAADETFRLSASTVPADLEPQLQVVAAAIADAGFRPQGEAQYRRNIANFFARKDATPESVLGNAIGGIVSDEDPRFTLQSEDAFLALDFAQLRDAIGERLAHGAVELALVGDFDEERAIALVAATLGALPPREVEFSNYADNRDRSFTADRSARLLYHDGAEDQALIRLMWPTRDDADFREAQGLELLERVVRARMIDVLREELGQTYSPRVSAQQSRVYPGWGTFMVGAAVDVGQVDAAREAMRAAIASLRDAKADEDLLLRARQPYVERYENALKTNRGWMGLVDRAQTEPERIARFVSGEDQLKTLTAEELQALAIRYLDPAQALEVVVVPRPAEGVDISSE